MQEFNIVRLLSDCSFDCIIGAGIACVIIFVFKRFLKASTKICLGLAFIIGAAATASISAFLLKESAEVAATKAVTAGGVAAGLTAFMKKFAFTDKEELKSNIEKLLSSIVLSDELDKVVIKNDTLRKYFPRSYTPKQMEDTIIKLLDQWQRKQHRQNER